MNVFLFNGIFERETSVPLIDKSICYFLQKVEYGSNKGLESISKECVDTFTLFEKTDFFWGIILFYSTTKKVLGIYNSYDIRNLSCFLSRSSFVFVYLLIRSVWGIPHLPYLDLRLTVEEWLALSSVSRCIS
jgi:hypothetical protein